MALRKLIPALSLVLHGHMPFIPHSENLSVPEEALFFETLSETWLPLLMALDRLERDRIPFRLAFSLSPVFCHLFTDELLLARYVEYTERQIAFGNREMERAGNSERVKALTRFYRDQVIEKRDFLLGRWNGNILKALKYHQTMGRIEILATGASHAFLPFYAGFPEAVQAQFETAISSYCSLFGTFPQGFWLPELGWSGELDSWLRSYNMGYTIVDSHGLVFARPPAEKGTFYPGRTPLGVFILGRDFYGCRDLAGAAASPLYRDNRLDSGYDLPREHVALFLGAGGARCPTGYKYWNAGDNVEKGIYDPQAARALVAERARRFLQNRAQSLREAAGYMEEAPLCLIALSANFFGRAWYEGPLFLESFFREAARQDARQNALQILTPAEYLSRQEALNFQTLTPEFSSWGTNGYGEMWLDASNDWMYRHTVQALERMTEIAGRFPDASGLKERSLSQAAREVLLVMNSVWPKMLYKQELSEYVRDQIETGLRNFTTIYEALGSNYISTEWLTRLEREHNIFPRINYRVFRRKI